MILKQKYENKLPISEANKNDLVSLCRSLVVPAQYHNFYTAINTEKRQYTNYPCLIAENKRQIVLKKVPSRNHLILFRLLHVIEVNKYSKC